VHSSGRGFVTAGPLVPYAEGFRSELRDRGYTRGSAAKHLHLMAHVSRWLAANQLAPSELDAGAIERFLEARRRAGYRKLITHRAMGPLRKYLHDIGIAMTPLPAPPSDPMGQLLERYGIYLASERGMAAASIRTRLQVASRFLAEVSFGTGARPDLSAAEVTDYLQRECGRRSVGSAKVTVSGLRALLGFLYISGEIVTPLAQAVPSAAGWRLAPLPGAITAGELAAVLGSCDRRSVVGRRDFAILTVLARLGLRAGEVAALALADIDWRQGQVAVKGKGRRCDLLPLPDDVGRALVAWLRRGRPNDANCPVVFTCVRAPHGPMSSTGVSAVVRLASERAGIRPIGAHVLRHTAATEMLRSGATLAQVNQVLRHRRLNTTVIYAKVDVLVLSTVMQPWPGAES
jgi:integrase/recombinase XerD